MYLCFSDWTQLAFIKTLNDKGIAHGGRIIKVYASKRDPREVLHKPNLFFLQSSGEPFRENGLERHIKVHTLEGASKNPESEPHRI